MKQNWKKILGIFILSISIGPIINLFVAMSPNAEMKSDSIEEISENWRMVFIKKEFNNLSESLIASSDNEYCHFDINAMGLPFIGSINFLAKSCDGIITDRESINSNNIIYFDAAFWGILIFPLVYIFYNRKDKIKNKLEKLQIKDDGKINRHRLRIYKGIAASLKVLIIIVAIILILIVINEFIRN